MPEQKKEPSIGDLYGRIQFTSDEFGEGERKLVKEPDHAFVALCKRLAAFFPSLGKGGKFTPENQQAIDFLKWRISPEEFNAASKIVLLLGLLLAVAAGSVIAFTPLSAILSLVTKDTTMALLYAYLPFMLAAAFVANFFQSYPSAEARREQTRALTFVPEMMGYMIMSIKLVPNLEKAVEFAAEHGRGKIAKDFKGLVWQTQVGAYNSLSEGLDSLAYRWGKYSQEFKRSLMRIRASVIENSEPKRYALLDQTLSEMLESIRNRMEQYARDLSQPSTMLFYIGVLLPLLLIIILPIGSSFSGASLANPVMLVLIYNVVIPLAAVAFAYNLIQSRPPTYDPPVIPDNYPGLPPKGKASIGGLYIDVKLLAALILIAGVGASVFVSVQGIPPKFLLGGGKANPDGSLAEVKCTDKKYFILPCDVSYAEALARAGKPKEYFEIGPNGQRYNAILEPMLRTAETPEETKKAEEEASVRVRAEEQLFFAKGENDVAPYKLIFGFLVSFSLAVFALLHFGNLYKRKAQLEIQELESDFKDSLYVIASRMGENRPVEDAMKHVQDFLPESKVSKLIFARTLENITMMGMPLEQAAFDKRYGSVANIPSNIIKTSMKMLVDSVQLGVNVSARTMISLSIQLQNAEKVNNNLKVLVSDVTGTMKTMTLFIAPIVLGITTSLQRIVIVTIASIASSDLVKSANNIDIPGQSSFSSFNLSGFISPDAIANIATPTQFILIVAFYIIELVVIMTYFTTKIEEDNETLFRLNVGQFLPVSVVMFVASMVAANLILGGA
ncbi:Uncharacterised protein [uncultured archaeon]|nr:Uncharacterised protein [uncultured archaeon]